MEIYEFEEGTGFGIDYELTCWGDSISGITLVMDFLYEEGELKSILRTIDAIWMKFFGKWRISGLKQSC